MGRCLSPCLAAYRTMLETQEKRLHQVTSNAGWLVLAVESPSNTLARRGIGVESRHPLSDQPEQLQDAHEDRDRHCLPCDA
jgi:hypothetical protein